MVGTAPSEGVGRLERQASTRTPLDSTLGIVGVREQVGGETVQSQVRIPAEKPLQEPRQHHGGGGGEACVEIKPELDKGGMATGEGHGHNQ